MKTHYIRPTRLGRTPDIGAYMYLDHQTPDGLFEDNDGNRFIVAQDEEYGPLAIVFRHARLPVFTSHVLTDHSLETGRWWGPFRVRLMSAAEPGSVTQYPGVISVMERAVSIDCHCGIHGGSVMPLGDLRRNVGGNFGAESWNIMAAQVRFRFCALSRLGTLHYGSTPLETTECENFDSVVELDPRSVME